jgi:Mn2+/Fe2+ NRAMP family transporter
MFGVPPWLTVIVVTFILSGVVLSGRYWTFEKVTLFFCLFNLVYIPAALWAMEMPTAPPWSKVVDGFYRPELGRGLTSDLIFVILANIGTTIAPWMIFFQQSAVVDKGFDIKDVKYGKIETFIGAVSTCLVAVFIIIAAAAAFYYHKPPIAIEDAKQTAEALVPLLPHRGEVAKRLFALGLFDAGFLGAICISLSSSWAVGEVFGWAHSLNDSVRDAPWFYLAYFLMLLSAGAVVLITHAPLVTITMFVQVVAVTLLPSALVFLLLLLNDKPLMGDHVNTRSQNIANGAIVVFVAIMSTLLGVQTLFPQLFR